MSLAACCFYGAKLHIFWIDDAIIKGNKVTAIKCICITDDIVTFMICFLAKIFSGN